MASHNLIDLTGQTFGCLTVVSRVGNYRPDAGRGRKKDALWRCQCSCGEIINAVSRRLRIGKHKACGVNGHHSRPGVKRGGIVIDNPNEYRTFSRMHERCTNPKKHNYHCYGGRGIKVCDRWQEFKNFLADMGPRPPNMTLERINVNGNYEPSNCKWATSDDQRRNQRRSVYVEWRGKRLLLLDLCKQFGLNLSRVYQRLKLGWTLEKALNQPIKAYRKKKDLPSPLG